MSDNFFDEELDLSGVLVPGLFEAKLVGGVFGDVVDEFFGGRPSECTESPGCRCGSC